MFVKIFFMWLSQSCCIKSHFPVSLFVTFGFFLLFVPCLWGLFVDSSALAIFVVMVLYVFIIGKMQDGNMESNQIKGNQITCFTLPRHLPPSFFFSPSPLTLYGSCSGSQAGGESKVTAVLCFISSPHLLLITHQVVLIHWRDPVHLCGCVCMW